ncbi:hypothetical protein ACFLWZ_03410 [Chloroflexota bacterium]
MVNMGNNSYIPDISAVVHLWCDPAFIYSSLHLIHFTVIRCLVIAALTVLRPVILNQQRCSWDKRGRRACLAWLGISGVIRRRERYNVQSFANEAPAASLVKAPFSEAAKVKISRKI